MPPPGDATTRSPGTLLDAMPPAFLCVTRKLQDRPYEALPPRKLAQASAQQAHLRPPPHVAKQALVELYAALGGHCGVRPVAPGGPMELVTYQSYQQRQLAAGSAGSGGVLGSVPHPAVGGGPVAGASGGLTVAVGGSASPVVPLPAEGGAGVLSALEDFRLQQIRQNENQSKRVCHYFQTREGCRRGAACVYQHTQ